MVKPSALLYSRSIYMITMYPCQRTHNTTGVHRVWRKENIMKKITVEVLLEKAQYNNELMAKQGKLIAMLHREGYNYCIVLDSHFNRLSANTQAFVLLHEVGHYLDNPLFGNDLNFEDEHNADLYALNALGQNTVLEAMNELYQYIAPLSIVGAAEIGVRMQMMGFDVTNMWMLTAAGKITGDQFKLIFTNPESIVFK